ncbi:MAG: methyltransferase 11 protein [Parcubacteria group bacterium]|nr:methyltransferase 11 protein [Parcubacteria group bacterium]
MKLAEKIYTTTGRKIELLEGTKAYNLGCGNQVFDGVIGIDARGRKGANILHDLNNIPWPIEDSSADVIFMFQTLEHLDNVVKIMEEIWRISKNKARIIIETPYFRHEGAFQDPTHKHFFTSATMQYFCVNEKRKESPYSKVKFRQVDFWYGWPAKSKNPIINFFKRFMRKNPKLYDGFLSKIFPAKIIVYELEAIK